MKIKLFSILCCILITTNVFSYDFIVKDIAYGISSSNTVKVMQKDEKYSGEIDIPKTVSKDGTTYSVTSIGSSAFNRCTDLTSITIPSSVTTIEEAAFYNCSILTDIIIPNSITTIENYAFLDCTSLTIINIPNSLTSIGAGAFNNCSNLININVESENTEYSSSNGVLFNKNQTTIIRYPSAKQATTYTIPSSVSTTEYCSFQGCSNLILIIIPTTVTDIGVCTFNDCSSLSSVTIPSSVTTIGDLSFFNCSNLSSIIVDSNNTNYSAIDGILFDKTQKTLIQYPIAKQTTSYTIPSTVEAISSWAFGYCINLTSITIPKTIGSLGLRAFAECRGLKSIHINKETPVERTNSWLLSWFWFEGIDKENCILYVPIGSKSTYEAAYGWKDFQNIVEEATNIKQVLSSELGISINNNQLFIKAIAKEANICVRTLDAKIIYNKIANEGDLSIPLASKGIYIVKVGNKSTKVINH